MCYAVGEISAHFESEVRRKRAMCYRPPREHYFMDGLWRPAYGGGALAVMNMEGAIEADIAARRAESRSEEWED